jgi:hypothetical protein
MIKNLCLWKWYNTNPIRCKEFLNASWWYFVGRRPARRAGRRPKHLSSFIRLLIQMVTPPPQNQGTSGAQIQGYKGESYTILKPRLS